MMFKKMSHPMKAVLLLAQHEARQFGALKIGTEHILLGMTIEVECGAAMILSDLRVNRNAVRDAITQVIVPAPRAGEPQFTSNGIRVLQKAHRHSLKFGQGRIGTEHVLLAMLEEEQCSAYRVLMKLGVNANEAHAITLWMLSGIEDSILELAESGEFEEASKRLLLAIQGAETLTKRLRSIHERLILEEAARVCG